MSQAEPTTPAAGWRPPVWLAPLLLAGLIWFSHFYWSSKFGLYEDDYFSVEQQMNNWRFRDVRAHCCAAFEHYFQGRPLLFVFGHALSWASATTPGGSLARAYVLAFGVTVLNAWLMLLVARRAVGPRFAPFAAALFALAPADTTHQFLHVCFCVQPSVTFLFLSLLAYQSGRRVLAVAPAALTLITYESCFLPLVLAPFLTAEAPRARRVLAHGTLMGAVLLTALAVRSHLGESRMKQEMSDRGVVVKKVVQLVTRGPLTSLEAVAVKPASAVRRVSDPNYFRGDGLRPLAGAWAALAASAAAAMLTATGAVARETVGRGQLVRVALAAGAMIVLAYPVLLNRNPEVLEGRMSSVHIAAAPGWALLAGAGLGLALSPLPRFGRRALWAAAAAYLAVLALYFVSVQRDYARAWGDQRRFWSEIARLSPDMDDGTIILYPWPRQVYPAVEVNSHADYLLAQRMFVKAPYWRTPPVVAYVGIFRVGQVPVDYAGYDWSTEVRAEGTDLFLMHWSGQKLPLQPHNVIALYPDAGGGYHRVTGALEVNGVRLPLREPSTNPNLVPTPLRWQLAPIQPPIGPSGTH